MLDRIIRNRTLGGDLHMGCERYIHGCARGGLAPWLVCTINESRIYIVGLVSGAIACELSCRMHDNTCSGHVMIAERIGRGES